MKFIQNIAHSPVYNHLALPNLWFKALFNIPASPDEQPYFYEFFKNRINLLNCKIKVPRAGNYKGHPFYYKILKTTEFLFDQNCKSTENYLSTPIWFNKNLNTKFDPEISKAGFNFIKDIFPENQPVVNFNGLRACKKKKLKAILE